MPLVSNVTPFRVLLVEDSPDYAALVRYNLGHADGARFEVDHADRLADALARLEEHAYDAMLLDLSLPDSYGPYTVFSACSVGGKLPVIVLTATDSAEVASEAVRAGAEDYLVKDRIDPHMLSGTIIRAIERHHRGERRGDTPQRLRDSLTGLPTASVFWDRLETAIHRADRHSLMVGVMHLELDRFQQFYDTWGPRAGEAMLQTVSAHLTRHIRASATVARMGFAAFGFVLDDVEDEQDIARTASSLLESVTEVRLSDETEVLGDGLMASIGVAIYPSDAREPDELLLRARTAQRRVARCRTPDEQHPPRRRRRKAVH